jgi:hypothetical protein
LEDRDDSPSTDVVECEELSLRGLPSMRSASETSWVSAHAM